MKQKRFSDEQIISILKEADAGAAVLDLCRRHGMSSATFYTWKSKCGGLKFFEAKRLRGLEEENGKLKRLLAEAMLDNARLPTWPSCSRSPARPSIAPSSGNRPLQSHDRASARRHRTRCSRFVMGSL